MNGKRPYNREAWREMLAAERVKLLKLQEARKFRREREAEVRSPLTLKDFTPADEPTREAGACR